MRIEFKIKENVLVVKIMGKLVGEETIQARRKINERLKNQKKVIFDLSKMDMTDGAGLGVFISCQTLVQKQEGKIVFFGLNERLNNLFIITRLKRVFTIFETQEEAIKSFS